MTASRALREGRFAVLTGNRAFATLWSARTASYFGDFISLTAIMLYLYERNVSAFGLGVALAARALPQALGPLCGALADRWEPRRLMVGCDLLRVGTVGAIALTLPPFPVFLVLIAATSVLSTCLLPSGKSSVPKLVDRRWPADDRGVRIDGLRDRRRWAARHHAARVVPAAGGGSGVTGPPPGRLSSVRASRSDRRRGARGRDRPARGSDRRSAGAGCR